ncbi:diacylglycerol kinase [Candidatus Falkowbacteria bacterium CG10_big_fil_rev_8_21_14_0_10_37_14]|uniref:Diacylglycerol kinase n=1 Tax=Candidatus Falkowbacteria bacterium CG10_big_fil_rev_8_21_14_0_10_37_14 TaxID=1974561 RepID=A0A2M6WTU0_9BACT|nr:diacylglycerol kinase family protein [Candidatus Falkowbacteria bacterium]PIT96215.1 MAG: diacylglycerol kinase [Candidatus Falkowbacteria bacterium CG10_big_fil_rev_8_21_14_0_10_37_14]
MISWKRIGKSFNYAVKGFVLVWRREQNLRLETFFGILVLIVAWYLKIKATEIAILILTIGFVLLMEMVNSLVEFMSDLLKPKLDHYVKNIKDVGAAVVLLAAIIATVVGLFIFVPYLPIKI